MLKDFSVKKIPLAAFCLFFLKGLVLGFGVAEVAALAVLCVFASYFEYKKEDKELVELKDSVKSQKQEIDNLKAQVSAVKMGVGFKSVKF